MGGCLLGMHDGVKRHEATLLASSVFENQYTLRLVGGWEEKSKIVRGTPDSLSRGTGTGLQDLTRGGPHMTPTLQDSLICWSLLDRSGETQVPSISVPSLSTDDPVSQDIFIDD